ncbi:hypothetical protein R1sor_021378 [Riccia sorocarpa]|uniref:NB-ARC domain-containing protein n=1 Tax=Riccia sorocarpa TaxID=122646 RepID=A0ABD3GGW6_9MARC
MQAVLPPCNTGMFSVVLNHGTSVLIYFERLRRYVRTDEVNLDNQNLVVTGDPNSNCDDHEMRNKGRQLNEASTSNCHLGQTSQQGIQKVERKLPMLVPEVTVGVDALISDILGTHIQDHRFVGFCGMGGVGKTTLAKLIFNKICAKFEFSGFVEEIKQFRGTNDEVKRIIWEKMRCSGVPVGSSSGSSGRDGWSQVTGKSLLLVFDDVEEPSHVRLLEEIARENGMEESRFVLTSRNAQRLADCWSNVHTICVDFLGSEDAKKLFTTYAFRGQEEAPESFSTLVEQVVEGCDGLPLTLEVLGKYLRGKSLQLWAEIPAALRECNEVADLEERVWAKLRLSYDGLPSPEVQNMFLDIASFFEAVFPAKDAIMAWSAMYDGIAHNRLEILEARALLTVRHMILWKKFYMHEHLRRMGQRIAREEGRSFDLSRIRYWSKSFLNREAAHNSYPYDDHVIFERGQELGKIVAHRVHITGHSLRVSGQNCAFCIMREVWPRLTAIRYMEVIFSVSNLIDCNECKVQRATLPSTLVLLSLNFFKTGDFVLSSEGGRNSIAGITRSLALTRCGSLVKLDLSFCHNVDLGGLNELRCMRKLRISNCNAVYNWPPSLRELRNLERLELQTIRTDFELPFVLGDLTNLQHLCIDKSFVTFVSNSLQKLTSLQFLKVVEIYGPGTETTPNIIGAFHQLQVLDLKCWAILDLEDAVGELVALRKLYLQCEGILKLPDTLGNLTNLEELLLRGPIQSLPASVSNLVRLERVHLEGAFRDWSVIKERYSYKVWCHVKSKESEGVVVNVFHHLHGLMIKQKELQLECAYGRSAFIVSHMRMVNLESLGIQADAGAVPDIFEDLHKLRSFKLTCSAVEDSLVESLRLLCSLEHLRLDCKTVEQLPDLFGCFSTLKTLRISCPSLHALPATIGNFIQLTEVEIWSPLTYTGYTGLRSLPDSFTKLSNLQSLSLRNLQLETLPEAFGNLTSLQRLEMLNCAVESLPESLGRLSALTHLSVSYCRILKTVPETIGELSSLTSLDVSGSSLHSLPESLSRLSGLTSLVVSHCENLKTLPETIGDLTRLKSLNVSHSALDSLPERLGELSGLSIAHTAQTRKFWQK